MQPIIESDILMQASFYGMLACLGASLLLPWISASAGRGYRIRWTAALVLSATLLFLAMQWTMPRKYNIRVDLVICPPLLLIGWVHCAVLALVSSSRQPKNVRPGRDAAKDGNSTTSD